MSLKDTADSLLKGDVKGAVENLHYSLERSVGLMGVIIISLSSMLGSGLFVLPSLAGAMVGHGLWLAFILAATVVLPGALSKSELASAMPTSGGSYVYVERTFGPLFGTIAGIGLWASFLLKASFALVGFAAYLAFLTYTLDIDVDLEVVTLSLLGLIVILNILGVKKVKAVQAPIVGFAVVLLILICIRAAFMPGTDLETPLSSAFEIGTIGLAEAAAFVFVSYAGVTKIAAIAEEVKNPGKNLPGGILLSLLAATLLYSLVAFMLMAALPDQWWLDTEGNVIEDPIRVFAEHVGGSWVAILASILAILTMASMALAGVLAASRFLFAMARDNLLPQSLENVNAKWETPHWPIIITGGMMGAVVLLLPVADIAKLASGFKIMIFMVINFCVIVLRRTKHHHPWYKPVYLSPMYPWIQVWGIVAGLGLILLMGEKAVIGALSAVVLGMITYFSYGKRHAHTRSTPFESFRQQFRDPTPEEHARRKAAFHAADMGGKDYLNLREFQIAMHALGFPYSDEDCLVIFHLADIDEDGVFDLDEFLHYFEWKHDALVRAESE